MMKLCVRGISFLLLTFVWVSVAQATWLQKLDRDQLVHQSKAILVGRCVDIQTNWNAKRTLIFTRATYRIEQAIKGVSQKRDVVVKALGGTVGTISQAVVDGPRFGVGSRDLLFLTNDREEPNLFRLVGLTQGKLSVQTDPATGEDILVGQGKGREAVSKHGPRSEGVVKHRKQPKSRGESLSHVLKQIKRRLKKP